MVEITSVLEVGYLVRKPGLITVNPASGELAPDVCCVEQMGQELLPSRGVRCEYSRVREETKGSSHSGASGCSKPRRSATGCE